MSKLIGAESLITKKSILTSLNGQHNPRLATKRLEIVQAWLIQVCKGTQIEIRQKKIMGCWRILIS